MRKISKLLSTIFFACSAVGFFSAAAINNQAVKENTVEVKEAKAYSNDDYFYFGVATNWNNNGSVSLNDFKNFGIHLHNATRYSSTTFGVWNYTKISTVLSDNDGALVFMDNGIPILRCKNYGATQIKIKANYSAAGSSNVTEDITVTGNYNPNDKNMLLVNSHNSGTIAGAQHAFWVHYGGCDDSGVPNAWNDSINTSTLYFMPNYAWSRAIRAYLYSWPYLVMNYSEGGKSKTYTTPAHGIMEKDFDPTSRSEEGAATKQYGFYFKNVPLVTPTSMYIYHNDNTSHSDVYSRSITPTDWYENGNLKYNFFTNNDQNATRNTSLALKGFYYYNEHPVIKGLEISDSNNPEYYLKGSFALNSNINFEKTGTEPSASKTAYGDFLPDKYSSFAYDSINDSYSLVTDVVNNDNFQYLTHDWYINTSTSGNGSAWEYNIVSNYGINQNKIVVVDENAGTTTTVKENGQVLNYNKYIDSGTTYLLKNCIKFKMGGRIEFKITFESTVIVLTLTYKNVEPLLEESDPSYIKGTFNGEDSGTLNSYVYNFDSSRYEAYIAAFADDRFQVWSTSSNLMVTKSSFDGDTSYLNDGVADNTGWIVINTLGFYRLEWYLYNDNPTGIGDRQIAYNIVKLSTIPDSNEAKECGVALGKRSSIYSQVCQNDYTIEVDCLNTLYNSFGSTKSILDARDDAMQSVVFNDYSYVDYILNGSSYEGLTPSVQTNGLHKYEWLNYLYGDHVRPVHGINNNSLINSETYQESNITLIIIITSISAAAIISLGVVNFLVIKKRKQKNK